MQYTFGKKLHYLPFQPLVYSDCQTCIVTICIQKLPVANPRIIFPEI